MDSETPKFEQRQGNRVLMRSQRQAPVRLKREGKSTRMISEEGRKERRGFVVKKPCREDLKIVQTDEGLPSSWRHYSIRRREHARPRCTYLGGGGVALHSRGKMKHCAACTEGLPNAPTSLISENLGSPWRITGETQKGYGLAGGSL